MVCRCANQQQLQALEDKSPTATELSLHHLYNAVVSVDEKPGPIPNFLQEARDVHHPAHDNHLTLFRQRVLDELHQVGMVPGC